MAGFFITGTDTGVGKTVVTAALTAALRDRGYLAAAMKPVQTGHPPEAGLVGDAELLHRAGGRLLDPARICPFTLASPLAPAVAAEIEGREVKPEVILDAYRNLARRCDPLLVEGVGGLTVPLAGARYLVADLVQELGLPLLLVARPALGTLNHTQLTVAYAEQRGLPILGVVVCHTGPGRGLAESTALPWLQRLTGLPVWEFPYLPPDVSGYPPLTTLAPAGEALLAQLGANALPEIIHP